MLKHTLGARLQLYDVHVQVDIFHVYLERRKERRKGRSQSCCCMRHPGRRRLMLLPRRLRE